MAFIGDVMNSRSDDPGVARAIRRFNQLTAPVAADAPWTWTVPDVTPEELPFLFHRAHRHLAAGERLELSLAGTVPADRLADLVEGAGWVRLDSPIVADGSRRILVERRHTLADPAACVSDGLASVIGIGVNNHRPTNDGIRRSHQADPLQRYFEVGLAGAVGRQIAHVSRMMRH